MVRKIKRNETRSEEERGNWKADRVSGTFAYMVGYLDLFAALGYKKLNPPIDNGKDRL
jgi:hypothetical protein